MHVGSYSLGSRLSQWPCGCRRMAGRQARNGSTIAAHEQRQFYVFVVFVVVLWTLFRSLRAVAAFFFGLSVSARLFTTWGNSMSEYWLNGAPMLCFQRLALNWWQWMDILGDECVCVCMSTSYMEKHTEAGWCMYCGNSSKSRYVSSTLW